MNLQDIFAKFGVDLNVSMVILTVAYDGPVPLGDLAEQQALLRQRVRGAGWETPALLAAMPRATTFYFDAVSQIELPSWSRGRIALVGDAGACPSLLAGQGSALAMVEAYVLAAELGRSGDHRSAFERYHGQLASVVESKQDAAIGLAVAFAPRNRAQLLLRNLLMGLMSLPPVANAVMGRSLRDPITLPPAPAPAA